MDKIMDHEWFKYVNQQLTKIEQEKAARYAHKPSSEIDQTLYRHHLIVSSRYWHPTDEQATSKCFDWTSTTFPKAYLSYMQRSATSNVRRLAEQPYNPSVLTASTQQENQKTLVARIILLKLEYLLPQDDRATA
jgi:hypothetical protein